MGSSMLDNLGQIHVVTGAITASAGTAAALTSNDLSATLTRTAAGNYIVTFGDAFLSVPAVVPTLVDATFTTTDVPGVITLQAVSTASAVFNMSQAAVSATVNALADVGDIYFIAVGLRNN